MEDNVSDTIIRLQQAGVKAFLKGTLVERFQLDFSITVVTSKGRHLSCQVWMLTGDKIETAINIGIVLPSKAPACRCLVFLLVGSQDGFPFHVRLLVFGNNVQLRGICHCRVTRSRTASGSLRPLGSLKRTWMLGPLLAGPRDQDSTQLTPQGIRPVFSVAGFEAIRPLGE